MDCPECGTPLVTYHLADREAPVCERCGHVGIEAEHRAARTRVESWSDAIQRFYGTNERDEDVTVPVRATGRKKSSSRHRAETWTEALERFYGGSNVRPESDLTDEERTESSAPTPAPVSFEGRAVIRQSDASK